MSVWRVAPVLDQPDVVLTDWAIMELPDGDRHFAGYEEQAWQGRASSKIVEFDEQHMTGTTASGRVYHLKGPPGLSLDARYVWNMWKQINKVEEAKDISKEFHESQNQ